MITLTFQAAIDNASLQIGDIAYYKSNFTDSIFSLGPITSVSTQSIQVDATHTPEPGSFIMFSKDNKVNSSGLKGYYSEIKMSYSNGDRAELFAVSSEITQSSK
tara:strand:+ start:413 stop:724 length:312 start_codon:yes stop_codon:yes gene_type:complete